MSLLNDALKAAEKRQAQPAPSVYTSQGSPRKPRRAGTSVLAVAVVLLAAAGALGYFYLASDPAVAPRAADVPDMTSGPGDEAASGGAELVETTTAGAEPPAAPVETVASAEPGSRRSPSTTEPESTVRAVDVSGPDEAAPKSFPPAQPVAEPEPRDEAPQKTETAAREPWPDPEPIAEPVAATVPGVASGGSEHQPEHEQANSAPAAMEKAPATGDTASNDVKQRRQSPEQQDRDAARDIRKLLSLGDTAAARQVAADLVKAQDAPESRYALARGILARGDLQGSLEWVPAELAQRYPDLRLIRARALLAGGDLEQAVATLQQQVPPVADNVEYRVTLATLLQQHGSSDRAATHWAELIAWDDSRAPWWVGLAIALEGRGDTPAARRAYEQAAALPGLAPSLADYVRQRLQVLGAG